MVAYNLSLKYVRLQDVHAYATEAVKLQASVMNPNKCLYTQNLRTVRNELRFRKLKSTIVRIFLKESTIFKCPESGKLRYHRNCFYLCGGRGRQNRICSKYESRGSSEKAGGIKDCLQHLGNLSFSL